jgi:Domain of unknown function (DUF6285)
MHDRPRAPELITAVRQFLETELLPALTDPRLRFQALIAANVLGIVEREQATEDADLKAEWVWLATLLNLPGPEPQDRAALRQTVREGNALLSRIIREGAFDEPDAFRSVLGELRGMVERKLEVANPKYLAGIRKERETGS